MLRHSLARSAWRTGKHAAKTSRAFSATAQRPAEVELTVGQYSASLISIGDVSVGMCLLTLR